MKIEMGESLGASWMKHVKGCDIVQTNWKVSPRLKLMNLDTVQKILDELKLEFGEASEDVFGKDGVNQILRQTECDILGVKFVENGDAEVNALEVAIHLSGVGLCYSGYKHANRNKRANVSDDKVVAKLFGAAMTIFSSMGKASGEIAFASPIVREDLLAVINSRISVLERVLNSHGLRFKFKVYANNDFYREILRRVLSIADNVADTNELFLRAMQIYLACVDRWGRESGDQDEPMPIKPTGPASDSICGSKSEAGQYKAQAGRPTYNVIVNGEIYSWGNPMGAVARDVVRAYVERTPGITFEQLHDAFPRNAHGDREVVVVERDGLDMHRFSLPIALDDGTQVVVTNQWCGSGEHENWQRFRDHVTTLDREGLSIRIEFNQ